MNYTDHETVSFPLAIWLVARGVMPVSARKLPGGPPVRYEYTFDAGDIANHKKDFLRAVRLLTEQDRKPQPTDITDVPRRFLNVRPADQQ